MISSATGYLGIYKRFLKLVTVVSEVVWPDKCIYFGFCLVKYCYITYSLNFNGKRLQSISREIWINERQKFADIISISYQVNLIYVI